MTLHDAVPSFTTPMFEMHRVFCATPWELESERKTFHDMIGEFNEAAAIPKGILFVPVSLVNIRDKRPVQYVVEDNIQHCRNYLLVLLESWGPPERNYESDHAYALDCMKDPKSPMNGVSVIAKKVSGKIPADGLPTPEAVFSNSEEFSAVLKTLLSRWLDQLVAQQQAHGKGNAAG